MEKWYLEHPQESRVKWEGTKFSVLPKKNGALPALQRHSDKSAWFWTTFWKVSMMLNHFLKSQHDSESLSEKSVWIWQCTVYVIVWVSIILKHFLKSQHDSELLSEKSAWFWRTFLKMSISASRPPIFLSRLEFSHILPGIPVKRLGGRRKEFAV